MTAPPFAAAHRIADDIALPRTTPDVVPACATRDDRYEVVVVAGLDARIAAIGRLAPDARIALIADSTVDALHGREFVQALRDADRRVVHTVMPPGEQSKSLRSARRLWDWLASVGFGRRDVLIAFGGGVVCDVVGWVASAYMRGVPYVNVPSTLLGMVDGALGGKVAVNHPSAKNLLGAFYQPRGVVADVELLTTLDRRQLAAGLAETIKKAMIASPDYLRLIEDQLDAMLAGDRDALRRLVACAALIKTELVGRDPYEDDLRRPLNFGHTIGHPLETVTGYGPLLHGEAVALGMVVACEIAERRGICAAGLVDRLVTVLRRAGLPTHARDLPVRVRADQLVAALEKVRQIRAGSLRWVLPCDAGATLITDDVSEPDIREALAGVGIR